MQGKGKRVTRQWVGARREVKKVLAPIDISISGTERRQSIPNFSETIIEMVPPGDVCSWSLESRWLKQ